MSNLFQQLVNESLILDWAETLDWLFDDDKFSAAKGWNSGYIGLFSRRIQKFNGFSTKKGNFNTDSAKNLCFWKSGTKKKTPCVVFAKGDGIAKDFVRHMRNGIAHGLTSIYRIKKGELFIEILDFKDDSKKKQTAYYAIPVSYITDSYKEYQNIEKSIRNTKSKDRKQREKRSDQSDSVPVRHIKKGKTK